MEDVRPVVLVLDDDVSIRRSLGRLLRSMGLELWSFASGNELLACELPARPTCLLLDLYLADTTGFEILGQLSATAPDLPVVVMTGHVDESLRQRALQAGAVAFLTKPFDESDLLAAIQRAVARTHPPGTELDGD